MYNNVAKGGKKMLGNQKGDAAKKNLLKETMRRVKKGQIMDRGPMAQGDNQKFK